MTEQGTTRTPGDLPLVENWPTDQAADALLEELIVQRAVQSYLWALPAMNVVAMKEGAERVFGPGYNVMPIWRRRLDAKTKITTPNSDVIYAMAFLDLDRDGPMVIEVPPGLQGILDDFWQRPLTGPLTDNPLGLPTPDGRRWFGDVGLVGPDEGRGGRFVVLPPDFQETEPDDGFVFRSRTYGVFIFWRAFFRDPADLAEPVAAMEQTRIYPLRREGQAAAMQFPEGSGVAADLLFPRDSTYFDMLARFIQHEYVDPTEMDMRGMLASLGIVKGRPFTPDPGTRALLDRAALTAFKMSKAMVSHGTRELPGGVLWEDRQYINAFMGGDPFFRGESYLDLDNRIAYFTNAYSLSPAMAMSIVGKGAKYPVGLRDADGDLLSGSHSYRLRLPPDIPAKLFWSVTVYDAEHGSGLDNGQPLPSLNSMDAPEREADGSTDVHLGPERPEGARNWLRTVPGRGFFVIIRLYGPDKAYFDGDWKPDDIVRIAAPG
jgi:hypothetical protein